MMKSNDVRAFPLIGTVNEGTEERFAVWNHGMTLRDYFAGQVITSIVGDDDVNFEVLASVAYEIADAMLEARGEWESA